MKHNLDTNIDYFDRHLNKIRRTASHACVFLIVLATIPVAIARVVDKWDIASLVQLVCTLILICVSIYVLSQGYRKTVGIMIYGIDMVLMAIVTLDPQGNELVVLFFITPLLVAYLFFSSRTAFALSTFSYSFLSYLYFLQYIDTESESYAFEMVLLVFAGISYVAGLHVVVGLRHSIEKKLISVAHTDALTNLPNRMYFDQRLAQEISRSEREKTPLCLGLVDLDHFKSVNDSYGHECGDKVLTKVASLISDSIRDQDIACRVGGEELAVVMPSVSHKEAQDILERLRVTIQNTPFLWRSQQINLTISAGLYEYDDLQTKQSLYAKADEALYLAKQNGRNQTVYLGRGSE